ncbi:MAG: class I SAM-dependent methyltransferase, partial [Acidobacteriaceae bacterium]
MTGFASGAEPTGPTAEPGSTRDEQSVSRAVQSMFNGIAPRYDLLNHVLSANVDRIWWRRTARIFAPILSDPDSAVLDLCCGTGDMTLALLRLRPANGKPVVALDFSHQMLERAKEKFA